MTQILFQSPTYGQRDLTEVIRDIVAFLDEDNQSQYRLVIGTDSHERKIDGEKVANFVTAIVMHRIGKGGRYFWRNGRHEKVNSLRHKIFTETSLSLETASVLVPELNRALASKKNWELEIHIDVGTIGDTREMIKEVVNMVIGNGYKARTKPESFAASTVADKYT
jgi:predicted RNase H-related nuclease YkuK (DUF458 family)